MPTVLDKHWRLAESDYEVELTEFEFSIMRISASFERCRSEVSGRNVQASCIAAARRISS